MLSTADGGIYEALATCMLSADGDIDEALAIFAIYC